MPCEAELILLETPRSDLLFDLEVEAPQLFAMATRCLPAAMIAYREAGNGFAIPPTIAPFVDAENKVCRPPWHRRSFYISDEPMFQTTWHRPSPGVGVIAFKGMEPLVPDVEDGLIELASNRSGLHAAIDHFAAFEQKVPLALKTSEALAEARAALGFQLDYVRAFGALAPMPLPLKIMRHDQATVAAHRARVEPRVGARGWSAIDHCFAEGLAGYTYAFPHLPIRVSHYDHTSMGLAARYEEVSRDYDPVQVASDCIVMFSRILLLGYLPCSLQNLNEGGRGRGIGQLCNPANTVARGGFADVDSLTPMKSLSDIEFGLTAELSLHQILATVRYLLLGVEKSLPFRSPLDAELLMVDRLFWRLLEEGLRQDALGSGLDPRMLEMLEPTPERIRSKQALT